MTFQDLFSHLHRWVEMDGKVEIDYELADAAIREWINEHILTLKTN